MPVECDEVALMCRSAPAVALSLLLLAACTPAPDAHVPAFARGPYEPFLRASAVAIALREWRLFGSEVREEAPASDPASRAAPKAERQPGLWQRVGEYWWLGLDFDRPAGRRSGLHDEAGRRFPPEADERFAWSAVF